MALSPSLSDYTKKAQNIRENLNLPFLEPAKGNKSSILSDTPISTGFSLQEALQGLISKSKAIESNIEEGCNREDVTTQTWRGILKEILVKVRSLTEEIEEVQNKVPPYCTCNGFGTFSSLDEILTPGKCMPPTSPAATVQVVDTSCKSVAEEREQWSSIMERIRGETELYDGATTKNTSVQSISETVQANNITSAAALICNYTDLILTDQQIYMSNGVTYVRKPVVVFPTGKEALGFYNTPKTNYLIGVLSYRVGDTNMRLAIHFGSTSNGKIIFGVAFTPMSVIVNSVPSYLMACGLDSTTAHTRADVKHTGKWINSTEKISWVVRNANFLATASMTPHFHSVVQVELFDMRSDLEASLSSNHRTAAIGKSLLGVLPPLDTLECRCVVEITNLLPVQLKNGTRVVSGVGSPDQPPSPIEPFTKVQFLTSKDYTVCLKAIFSYRVVSTDIRFFAAFCVTKETSNFAVAFRDVNVSTTKDLISELLQPDAWKTRPDQQFGTTQDPELAIEARRIQAKASMSIQNGEPTLSILIMAV